MRHIRRADHGRGVNDGHGIRGHELLSTVVFLLAIGQVGGTVEPEYSEVNVCNAEGADFEDAGDAEAGVDGGGVEVGGAQDVDGGIKRDLVVVYCLMELEWCMVVMGDR